MDEEDREDSQQQAEIVCARERQLLYEIMALEAQQTPGLDVAGVHQMLTTAREECAERLETWEALARALRRSA